MNKFTAKSKLVLGLMALLSLIAFLSVENSKVDHKKEYYNEKLKASILVQKAEEMLLDYRLSKGIFIDNINDPNKTTLIGQDITPITTDRGYIEAKLTSLNPNFAAVVVEMLKEAEVAENDLVAVSFTGSLPGLNLAVLAAIQTLNLKPIIITSVGASNWGANNPDFTWLDIEKLLFDKGLFKFRSIAASIGGGLDKGRGLSPEGRTLIEDAIIRNDVYFINEDFLENSIEKRLKIYNHYPENVFEDTINSSSYKSKNNIKAFINVGGGIASLGSTENDEFIPTGLFFTLPLKNFPAKGVLIKMSEQNVPVIHLLNVIQIANSFGLPIAPEPLPKPGTGDIFVKKEYSLPLTIFVTLILSAAILTIFVFEKKRHKLGSEVVAKISQNEEEL